MKFDNITKFTSNFTNSCLSLIKIILLSKGCSPSSEIGKEREMAILGNGPSLRQTIDDHIDELLTKDLMAVNFSANTPDFFKLRPQYYILADGIFFNLLDKDQNVRRLWDNINSISWKITMLVPTKFKHLVKPLIMNNKNIDIRSFNLTPIEGFKWLKKILFRSGAGMPRPRNVMIPAIMESIRMGYKKIYLYGADHSWTKTLDVDNENFVISIQPHYYEDNEKELQRVRETYKNLKLHDVLGSMVIAFRSYWEIKDYADAIGVEILNHTPDSMIDAFSKKIKQ